MTSRQFASGMVIIILGSINTLRVSAQPGNVPYNDIARQRLLIRATAQYLHTISQGQIDMDSAIRIPCSMYGLSPFLAYNESYSDGSPSAGTRLLDAGNVKATTTLLATLKGEARLQVLVELGTYFIFRPGVSKGDLGEASKYIDEAIRLSATSKDLWKREGLRLKAFLLHQSGHPDESQDVFAQLIKLCEQTGNTRSLAQTLLNSGKLLPYGHPDRLSNFDKALSLFQTLQVKEKQIEALTEITIEHFVFKRFDVAEQYVRATLDLHKAMDYHHDQYVYDVLAYLADRKGNAMNAMSYSNKSLESLTSRADSVVASFFFQRKANLYIHLLKSDEAFTWFDKALENRSSETRLYWYKAFLGKVQLYNHLGKGSEALALIEEIGHQFPPITSFEKMFFTISRGEAYSNLRKYDLAERDYKVFLTMAENYPAEYIHGEFPDAFYRISHFYRITGRTEKARELLEIVRPFSFGLGVIGKGNHYYNLFKVDSTDKRYLDAINDIQLSRTYMDSALNFEQRKKTDELLVKYEAVKKDRDIQLLKQQSELQATRLQQSRFVQNMTFAGGGVSLFIAGLLYYLYRIKQKSNMQLKHLLDEKEWLLKEVHHRVKNNLQTVLSLLESQARTLSNDALYAIQDSQNRVYAMSLIHKKLYKSSEVASISMEDYLRDLLQHLRQSLSDAKSIHFPLDLDPVKLDVSQAVPVGLIVNEAVTNAIKYAFPEKTEGDQIAVLLKQRDDLVELRIEDNGVGFSGERKGHSGNLGLKLMKGLTGDIDGDFQIHTIAGVSIIVRFVANVPLQGMKETVTSKLVLHY